MFQPAYRTKGGAFVVAPPPPCFAPLIKFGLKIKQVIFCCFLQPQAMGCPAPHIKSGLKIEQVIFLLFFYGLKHQATQPHISNLA